MGKAGNIKKRPTSGQGKYTRPDLPGALERERLFRLLDRGRKKPLIWVSSPAGAGKTTLVSSYIANRGFSCLWYQLDPADTDPATFFYYLGLASRAANPRKRKPMPVLTPEFMMGIPAFTRRFFDEMFSRLRSPAMVVFDNFQEAAGCQAFMDVLGEGIAHVPEGISVVMLSRESASSGLARRSVNGDIFELGWEDLRLTETEAGGMAKKAGVKDIDIKDVHARASGWAAGVVLFLEGVRGEVPQGFVPDRVFDYFASEVFRRMKPGMRDFLLNTAFLPAMTEAMADDVTGKKGAGRVLRQLVRMNYFTQCHLEEGNVYNYHPLFREFLLDRARDEMSAEEYSLMRQRSAAVLAEAGRFEDAAELFIKEGQWSGLKGLVMTNAPDLLAQGRNNVLLGWLGAMPQEAIESDPWMLYWMGAASLPYNPGKSQETMERAFYLFDTAGDTEGIFLSWAGVVDSISFGFEDFKQLDKWIDLIDGLETRFGGIPEGLTEALVVSAMFCALIMRQPSHPGLEAWRDRALEIARHSPDLNLRVKILLHHLNLVVIKGNLDGVGAILSELRHLRNLKGVTPLALQSLKMAETMALLWLEDAASCCRAARDGLEHAQRIGIHIYDFMMAGLASWGSLNEGHSDQAEEFMKYMAMSLPRLRPWDECFYLYLLTLKALSENELNRAWGYADRGMKMNSQVGSFQSSILQNIANAQVSALLDERETAAQYLKKSLSMVIEVAPRSHLEFVCHLVQAQVLLKSGDEHEIPDVLKEAFVSGARSGFFITPVYPSKDFSRLCEIALENGIETDYVKRIIRKRGLEPGRDSYIEDWPYPLRIRTLGKFEVERDGGPLKFTGKAPGRPLALLKALAAMGESEVSVEFLTDALWPEAEGDAAAISLKTTLHRLRRLLGRDSALATGDGKVVLDTRHCWLDSRAFEVLSGKADDAWHEDAAKAACLYDKALALYTGDFLPSDADLAWTIPMRERLKAGRLKALLRLGSYCEAGGAFEKAAGYYEAGLEADLLREDIARSLLRSYQRLGRRSDAIKTYERLREALRSNLGITPEEKTESLYRSILN